MSRKCRWFDRHDRWVRWELLGLSLAVLLLPEAPAPVTAAPVSADRAKAVAESFVTQRYPASGSTKARTRTALGESYETASEIGVLITAEDE